MMFTDPPYNVDYKGGTKEGLSIQNDKMSSANFYQFLYAAFTAAASVVKPGGGAYVCHSDRESISFRKSLIDSGWQVKNCLIWVKNHFVLGRMDYHLRHEPILYGWRDGAGHKWYGGRKNDSVIEEMAGISIDSNEGFTEISLSDGLCSVVIRVPSYEVVSGSNGQDTTIWKVNKPLRNLEHPTIKPVEIPARAIRNSSKNGDKVLDLFLGSGTTVIACEQEGRVCYGLELDEKYCDVIIRRWQSFSGRAATLNGDGRNFAEVSAARSACN